MDTTPRNARLSLVIPAYNEAAVIAQAITEAEESLAGLFPDFEILVVDDGSRDSTAKVVTELLPKAPHTRLLRHSGNRGYGAALCTGFEAARFELVAFTDADCQFHLQDLAQLCTFASGTPVVVGYRRHRQDNRRRRFFSWGYNRLARTLLKTKVRDVDCALKLFHRETLAQLLPASRGFFVNTEMMARAQQLGIPVIEVPVQHRPRASGVSKVSLREIPQTAATLLRYWWSEVVCGPRSRSLNPIVFQARLPVPEVAAAPVPEPPPSSSPAIRVGLPGPYRADF